LRLAEDYVFVYDSPRDRTLARHIRLVPPIVYGNVVKKATPSEIFKARLREVRDLRGLSQADLAQRTDLQPAAVSHFETGLRKPSFENLRRLADALAVSSDYLLGRVNDLETTVPSDPLFRHFERLSEADRDVIRKFTASLARKKEP
jgi:transcriptional regulator with XRE-family HTH domain